MSEPAERRGRRSGWLRKHNNRSKNPMGPRPKSLMQDPSYQEKHTMDINNLKANLEASRADRDCVMESTHRGEDYDHDVDYDPAVRVHKIRWKHAAKEGVKAGVRVSVLTGGVVLGTCAVGMVINRFKGTESTAA